MNVIISGAAGFIGSHLCDFYLKMGHSVIGLDNLSTGVIENINHLKTNDRFKFIEIDVSDEFNIEEKIDIILHFASPASPIDYLNFPIKTLLVGSRGTFNMLNLAKKNNATILVASTSEVYGDPLEHPQSENYFGNVNPIGPRGVYDEAKRYLEAISMAFHRKYNLNIKIVRIFNTYGPRMRINDGRAVPTFINQAMNNKDFTVHGDGNQTRSFCFIDDTINGIAELINSNYNYPVNIGNPDEYSVLELITKIRSLIPSNSKLTFTKLSENDPKVRKPNINLAKKLLNWEPKIELNNGLKKTINYYQDLSNFKI